MNDILNPGKIKKRLKNQPLKRKGHNILNMPFEATRYW